MADSGNQVIITAQAIGSGAESGCFPQMLSGLEENMKMLTGLEKPLKSALVEGDTGYFSEENLREAAKREIEVLIPDSQFRQRDPYFTEKKEIKVKKNRKYTLEDFRYEKKKDCYICPAGKKLEYKHHVKLRNNSGKKYQAKSKDCIKCPKLERCTKNRSGKKHARTIYIIDRKYENIYSQEMRQKIDEPVNRILYSRRIQRYEQIYFTDQTQGKYSMAIILYCP
jgi:hypothetical protein